MSWQSTYGKYDIGCLLSDGGVAQPLGLLPDRGVVAQI